MKLTNLSICLILTVVFSGCFNGAKPIPTQPSESLAEFEELNLKTLDTKNLFGKKGELTPKGEVELKSVLKSQNAKEPFVFIGENLDESTIKNIENAFAKVADKRQNAIIFDKNKKDIVGGIFTTEFSKGLINFKPMPFCSRYLDKCFKLKELKKINKIKG